MRCRNVEGGGARRSGRRAVVAAILAVVAVAAAGCGGSSPGAGPATSTAGGAVTTPATPTSGRPTTTVAAGTGTAASPTVTARPGASSTAPGGRPTLSVTADGLTVTSGADSTPIPFGSSRDQVVAALTGVLGGAGAPLPVNPECGNRADESIDWPGQLRLDFKRGNLISWRLDQGSPLTTDRGFGLGATRTQVESVLAIAVSDTSLGVEFTTDSEGPLLNGLLSGDGPGATVTELWAGQVCAFR